MSRRTGCAQPRQKSFAARAKSSFRWSLISVIVPTVEREVRTGLVWSMAIAGGMPSMASTCGLSMRSRNWRAYGRERLDVAALALGVERVEDERGLARARGAGDDDQLARREVDVEVLEVVLARAADADRVARRVVVQCGGIAGGGRRTGRSWGSRRGREARPKEKRLPVI